jgi:hypothetical protein
MAFGDPSVTLAGLLQMDLPGGTVRLCDLGDTRWGGVLFSSDHATFGTVFAVQIGADGLDDVAPGGTLTLIPAGDADADDLADAAMQGSALKMWVAEIDPATGLVTGTPEPIFDGLVDVPRLANRGGARLLDFDFISSAEAFLLRNDGNVLSDRWHQSIWPGELGLQNADGLAVQVAWGVDGAPQSGSMISKREAYRAWVNNGNLA